MDESSEDFDRESSRSENINSAVDTPQTAKSHPYLPTAQPLFPEEWIHAGTHRNENFFDEENLVADANECNSLAIFEIDDIVLFPGATLPLRLRDRHWVSYLGTLIDDARGLHGSHRGTAGRMGEVRMVIMPRVKAETRRIGRRRPRDTHVFVERSEGGEIEGRGPMGQWRVDSIRRGVMRTTRRVTEREPDTGYRSSRSETNDMGAVNDDESVDQSLDGEGSDLFRPAVKPMQRNDDSLVGRIGTLATITFTHEETTPSAVNPNLSGAVPSGEASRGQRSSSLVWQNRGEELVLTVLGTQRCRLVRPIKDENKVQPVQIPVYEIEAMNDGSATLPPSWMLQPPGNARCSIVPPTEYIPHSCNEEGDRSELVSSSRSGNGHNCAIRNLALRSSTPNVAYQALWPWKLCRKIVNLIQYDQYRGLRDILPSAAGLRHEKNGAHDEIPTASSIHVSDPSAFSNWISSNMPLSQDDRLDLLEMACTVQQLKFLITKLEDKKQESILRCKYCRAPISHMQHVFSVGGSCGTAGNYVNEHGFIHHTVTLRKVDGDVLCVGRSERRDSWFPGYSWQIALCSICSEHLGWKFRMVQDTDDYNLPDRPSTFWGFSSITTDEHIRPRIMSSHTDLTL